MKRIRPIGRPAEFRDRVRLTVFLERRERDGLQLRAAEDGLTASAFARRVLVSAVRKGARHAR